MARRRSQARAPGARPTTEKLFPGKYDERRGILDFGEGAQRLRERWPRSRRRCRLNDPVINYFERRNPGWRQGHELPCVAEISISLLKPYLTKEKRKTMSATMTPPVLPDTRRRRRPVGPRPSPRRCGRLNSGAARVIVLKSRLAAAGRRAGLRAARLACAGIGRRRSTARWPMRAPLSSTSWTKPCGRSRGPRRPNAWAWNRGSALRPSAIARPRFNIPTWPQRSNNNGAARPVS